MALLLTNIPWSEDPTEHLATRLGCDKVDIVEAELLNRSVDGRRRPPLWMANYRVVLAIDEMQFLKKKSQE